MEHECEDYNTIWFWSNNQAIGVCPKCGRYAVADFFDEVLDSYDGDIDALENGGAKGEVLE